MKTQTTIPLYKRNGHPRLGEDVLVAHTEVDKQDVAHLSQWLWRLHAAGYAFRYVPNKSSRYKTLMMHRYLMDIHEANCLLEVDHINGDRLDNRRSNLRVLTRAQAQQNRKPRRDSRSGLRGVIWHKASGTWRAQATLNRKVYSLGYFEDKHEAAAIASEWRREHMPYSVEPTQKL